VIHNFNADGFNSLYPKYKGGRPKKFSLAERREIKKIAMSEPTEHGLPFSTWSLVKLADFLVAEGVVDDISHEGLRILLRDEGVTFQRVKTWKTSRDPDYAAMKARVEHLYPIADGEVIPMTTSPVVFCLDEFGPPPAPSRTPVGRTRRQGQGPRPGAQAKAAGDLHPPARGPPPVRQSLYRTGALQPEA
jgi:transposase